MLLQDADQERKAAQARVPRRSGCDAKAVMLELAEHYENLAGRARVIAAMRPVPKDHSS